MKSDRDERHTAVVYSTGMRARPLLPRVVMLALLMLLPAGLSILCERPAAGAPDPARAPEEGDEAAARALFVRGTALFAEKRFAEALDPLEQSYRLVPSPNSNLLVARCLRELGRLVESLARFRATEAEAGARVAAGEPRYLKTQEAAAAEGLAVRGRLGSILVRVARAPQASIVEVDGKAAALPADGKLDVLHPTGQAILVVRPPAGAPLVRTVQVVAGSDTPVEIDFQTSTAPSEELKDRDRDSARPASSPVRRWAAPAALVSGGIGLIGVGLFTGFGLHSQAIYDRLSRECAPRCGTRRSEADQGDLEQTIANTSLVVGMAGVAAAAAFTVLFVSASGRERQARPRAEGHIELTLGAAGASVRGAF